MRYSEILGEGPAEDLSQNEKAEDIINRFIRWLSEYEDHPITDNFSVWTRNMKGVDYVFVPARLFDESYQDLLLGFELLGNRKTAHREASLMRGMDERKRTYFATIVVDFDPRTAVDIAFSISERNRSALLHELIHYFDYKRGLEKDGQPNGSRDKALAKRSAAGNNDAYFNDALERNAYYQQALQTIYQEIIEMAKDSDRKNGFRNYTIRTFDKFYQFAQWHFNPDWMYSLTPENTKALKKRLYKVYMEIISKWPAMAKNEQVTEAIEMVTSDSGRKLSVLVNPTKTQFLNLSKDWWHKKGRALIDSATGSLYIVDAGYMYHYDLAGKLGLDYDKCLRFNSAPDFIGYYENRMAEDWNAAIAANKNVKRIYGPNPIFKEIDPD